MNDVTRTSNQWNTPWRASGFAVYDTSGNLVAHTGITGNRSMHGKQLEMMAAMIAEAVNAYSAGEPPAARKCMANRSADPPQDCDAPFCGCNPAWDDCIKMLQESDLLIDRRAPTASQPPSPDLNWLSNARLDWGMVCECNCSGCITFDQEIRNALTKEVKP